jgi:hypothetical protein
MYAQGIETRKKFEDILMFNVRFRTVSMSVHNRTAQKDINTFS